MLLLEQNTTKKGRMDKKVIDLKLEAGNRKQYEVERIWDNVVYIK